MEDDGKEDLFEQWEPEPEDDPWSDLDTGNEDYIIIEDRQR